MFVVGAKILANWSVLCFRNIAEQLEKGLTDFGAKDYSELDWVWFDKYLFTKRWNRYVWSGITILNWTRCDISPSSLPVLNISWSTVLFCSVLLKTRAFRDRELETLWQFTLKLHEFHLLSCVTWVAFICIYTTVLIQYDNVALGWAKIQNGGVNDAR